MSVTKCVTACALASAALTAQLLGATTAAAQSIDPVVQWNRNLVAIVRAPDAHPATIHPTRSLPMLRATIYDAVNPMDQTQYANDLNEVQSRGSAGSTAATPDDALTSRFWNGAIQNYWNEIAQTVSLDRHLTTAQNARLFALLNVGRADGVIASFDAKYTYDLWRPVTAIRFAGTDDNAETTRDPNWLREVGNTTPNPAYPGAHAVISAAAVEVLVAVLERDRLDFVVTSEALPGVERSFASFSAAAEEAEQESIFAAVHFRNDLTSRHRLGRDVADFVLDAFLTRRHRQEEDGAR